MKDFITNIELVKLNLSDIQELIKISRKTYSDTFSNVNTSENMLSYLNDSFNEEKLTKELSDSESEFYFAKIKNEIAGYLKINLGNAQTDLKEDDGLEIERIYILEKYQGKKIGRKLMNKAIERAGEKQKTYIWLGVWEKNTKAIQFYEKRGFSIVSSHPFKMGKDLQTDFIMKLFLNK